MTENIDEVFLTADKFFHVVEELVWMDNISYIEATIQACTKFLIDPEDINKLKLINPVLKDRLKMDAIEEGFLKREAQLPL